MKPKEIITRRAAKLFKDGDVVNLGIGMPTMIMQYIPEDIDVWFDSENGVLGLTAAPENEEDLDVNLVDAGGIPGGIRVGGSTFSSFDSFGLIRGGHVDYTVLGAYEVDQYGSLANWMIPGATCAGMGGAMDLVTGSKNVVVVTTQTNKAGEPKVVKKTILPLTGKRVVTHIITDMAFFRVVPEGLLLEEVAPGVKVEDVLALTDADVIVADDVHEMDLS